MSRFAAVVASNPSASGFRDGWLKQALRLFWRPTAVGATITLIVATDFTVPIGWARLFVIVLWFGAVLAVLIALVVRLLINRRWRDAIWSAVATPLLLAAIGSTAGMSTMDALMFQADAGNYDEWAEQELVNYRSDQIDAEAGAIVLSSQSRELAVVFPIVSGPPSNKWGLV